MKLTHEMGESRPDNDVFAWAVKRETLMGINQWQHCGVSLLKRDGPLLLALRGLGGFMKVSSDTFITPLRRIDLYVQVGIFSELDDKTNPWCCLIPNNINAERQICCCTVHESS